MPLLLLRIPLSHFPCRRSCPPASTQKSGIELSTTTAAAVAAQTFAALSEPTQLPPDFRTEDIASAFRCRLRLRCPPSFALSCHTFHARAAASQLPRIRRPRARHAPAWRPVIRRLPPGGTRVGADLPKLGTAVHEANHLVEHAGAALAAGKRGSVWVPCHAVPCYVLCCVCAV